MNGYASFWRAARTLVFLLSICTTVTSAIGMQANVVRTNWVERWITNLIEVRMPLNRFVDEYQTNWVTRYRTNRIDVYATNLVTRTLTNRIVVDAFQTNFVTAYQTNWLTQVVTNEVQIDRPGPAAPSTATADPGPAEQKDDGAKSSSPLAAAVLTGPVVLEAARTAKPPKNGQVEVCLRVRARGDAPLDLQVQKWRVEREDRAILCFGQDQEFKRELPAGRYKVEVKTRQAEDSDLLTVRGVLVLTPGEAVIQQNLAAIR